MFGKNFSLLILFILLLGAALRLVLFSVSPPNNTYDDHLEVVNIYSDQKFLPQPSQCWECYQPPAYYFLGSIALDLANYFGLDKFSQWKVVQIINPLLAILSLVIFILILNMWHIQESVQALFLSFIALLPRDIYTSLMIGNDYLLVFLSILSVLFFLKAYEAFMDSNVKKFTTYFFFLGLSSILAISTKQHGLLLTSFPMVLLALSIRKTRFNQFTIIVCLVLGVWVVYNYVDTYTNTGQIMVSNQHYFNYADKQPPGSLQKVEFFSFRIWSLFTNPFLSEATLSSLPTEIFARTFFDYEWRFISPKANGANLLGIASYIIGIFWVAFAITIVMVKVLKNKSTFIRSALHRPEVVTIVIVAMAFSLVPIMQTLRFPHFSSMKSMFMLPGIWMFLLVTARFCPSAKSKYLHWFIWLNVIFGVISTASVFLNLEFSLNNLSGPLWSIPE